MPANLTPEYYDAKEKWQNAGTPEEEIEALKEMLRTIPKHKGTDKMQADIRRRLSEARERLQAEKKRKTKKRRPDWLVKRQGSGQVVMAGGANSGKSSLVAALTNAEPNIGDYPFTTTMSHPAMLEYENVQIQLVDLPPVHPEMSPFWLPQVIQGADGIALVVDLGNDDLLEKTQAAMEFLTEKNFPLVAPDYLEAPHYLRGTESPTEQEDVAIFYPTLVVGNKFDEENLARLRFDLLQEMWLERGYPRLPAIFTSVKKRHNLQELAGKIWHLLGKVRVYTQPPGHEPDYSAPFVLPRGSTALDLARAIHKEVGRSFSYARVWGKNTFDAQRVGREYLLHDGDILQVHTQEE